MKPVRHKIPQQAAGDAPFSNAARWIWLPGESSPVNAVADFQGRFYLKVRPRDARLRISADSRYRLHVKQDAARRGIGENKGVPCYAPRRERFLAPLTGRPKSSPLAAGPGST